MLKLISMVAAVIVWGLLSLTLPPEIFPGPIETARTLWGEVASGQVWTDLAMTMLRVVGGLVIALILGVPVGVLMGLSRRAEGVLDVWVMIGLTVPSLCYAIMAFMWFGLNEGAAIIAIAVTAAPSITINIWEGDHGQVEVRRVPDGSRQTVVRPGDELFHPGIAASTDGRYAAVVNEKDITLVEVPAGATRTVDIATATEIAFVGHRLFVVELAGALHEIDAADGRIVRTVKTGTTLGPYRPWAIDDTATTLAVLTPTGALELVDLPTETLVATLPPIDQGGTPQETGGQTWIGFPPGRGDLVSVTAGGSVVRWSLSVDEWRRVACTTAGRDLTAAEWRANTDAPIPDDLACSRVSGT